MNPKPYAESCDQNREPILAVLRGLFADRKAVLEIGSGTGQHAVYFGAQLPFLQWYTSDRSENHAGIRLWLAEAGLANVHPPLALDVTQTDWPAPAVDAVFSANTTHIMDWPAVESLFAGLGQLLPGGGLFALYGPFNYDGRYTSESNARFDAWLKQRDPRSGIRDVADLNALADAAGLALRDDFAMPQNNRLLCWERR
ncbi:MAG: class I SAM-dependent methyltransferase [Gammaproteobacteria bacterium]|nr:class I SAM-dependent methyltransferase [Gammaproteobacteria bacterium]